MSRSTNSTKRLLQHGMMVPDLVLHTAGWVLKSRGGALTNYLQGVGHGAVAAALP
ncbi:MAG: hypothetical protein WCD08_05045 [Steroidobacteraceae bacterium]